MRILHVVEAFGGGVFECLVALANHQAANPWNRVTIAYSLRSETPASFRDRFGAAVEFVPVAMQREINPKKDLAAAFELSRLYRKLRPNVVHLHSAKAGVVGRAAGVLAGQKGILYTPHGFSFLMRNASARKRTIYRAIERAATWLGGTVVGCSESEGRLALELTPRATYVPNGIEVEALSRVARASTDVAPQGPVVVAVSGRIVNQRNPAVFCEVARRVTQAQPGKFKFVWVGGGETWLLTPNSPIEVTGWLSRDRALKTLADADIYFHPSLWEGLPLAVLEAMALRLPVVATGVGGNRDAVLDRRTGFIADSVDSMVAAVVALGESPELRKEFGDNGALRVANEFSIEQMLSKYDRLYKDVCYT
jgi:glycosyltransferase involved in cell wall biosynthesis